MLRVTREMLVDQRFVQPQVFITIIHGATHRIWSLPVVIHDLGKNDTLITCLGDAYPELPILAAVPHRLVEPTDDVDNLSSEQCGAVHHIEVEQHSKITP